MFYQQSIQTLVKQFETNTSIGLTSKEAEKKLAKYGQNVLTVQKGTPLILKFLEQFKNLLVIVLLAATLVALILGETLDAIVIAAIVFLNAIIGFIQEYKAEKTLEALQEKDVLYALVLRNGQMEKIPSNLVVP